MSTRTFSTGATRDQDTDKYDYEGFLSPLVIERYGAYMHKNRHQSDGTLRDSDNWQKGMGFAVYMKSLWRHFHATWKLHRETISRSGLDADVVDFTAVLSTEELDALEDDLCGVLFNTMGYLHELRVLRGD